MRSILPVGLLLATVLVPFAGLAGDTPSPLLPTVAPESRAGLNLLPWPAKLEKREGQFALNAETVIFADPAFANEAELLAAALRAATGLPLRLVATAPSDNSIVLAKRAATELRPEGYVLEVRANGASIDASNAAGAFYGCQTLRQLVDGANVPCVRIQDEPRMAWRGLMLDVSRHFFDKQEVEAVLDQMATLKLNVFHWHLTDDHGWRIEIKKYPKLTTVGAWREITPDVKGNKHNREGVYGGFYTQDDIREIVAYAAARHIMIVPEVDIPGHCSAAMAAYPELAPDNGWKPIIATMQKGRGERCAAMCVAKEQTITFCKDVLEELLTLFPSKYIHVGGDEVFYEQWQSCPISQAALKKLGLKDMAELQIHFTNEMVEFLESKGRKAIVWNNIYRQTVDKRAVNQFWRDMNPARGFANAGYTVLLSESAFYYFDHHPTLERAYANDPLKIPGLTPEARNRIPGIEGCAWSERCPNTEVLYQHIYPLLFAYAETGWTPQQARDWNSFRERVSVEQQRFERLGIHGKPEVGQKK